MVPTNLFKFSDFKPQDRKLFEDADILNFEVFTEQQERVGKVADILMDEIGQLYYLYYLVIDIGSWLSHKLVLVTPAQFYIDRQLQQIHLLGLTKTQIQDLPPYESASQLPRTLNRQLETNAPSSHPIVSSNATSAVESFTALETSVPLENSVPLEAAPFLLRQRIQQPIDPMQHVTQEPPSQEPLSPSYASTNFENPPLQSTATSEVVSSQTIPLLEERLVTRQTRRKIGEVIFRKQIETRMVEIPIRREKLIIEQVSPELKQLAVVDLPGEQLSDIELLEVATSTFEATQNDKFISIELARQVLARLGQPANGSLPKVKLVFEDTSLQAAYQAWALKQPSINGHE
jgi:Domain of unknown function (DUF2382)/PRC-barrel domain